MFGKCLLIGILIAGISTCINIVFEYNENKYTQYINTDVYYLFFSRKV